MHDYKQHMMSVRDGGVIPRPEVKKRPKKNKMRKEKGKGRTGGANVENDKLKVKNPTKESSNPVKNGPTLASAINAAPETDVDSLAADVPALGLDDFGGEREEDESLMDAAHRHWAASAICVLDPFIPTKVRDFTIYTTRRSPLTTVPHVIFLFCRLYENKHKNTPECYWTHHLKLS